jgi:hypothetical protein
LGGTVTGAAIILVRYGFDLIFFVDRIHRINRIFLCFNAFRKKALKPNPPDGEVISIVSGSHSKIVLKLLNPVIWKEQVYWILWERLPAAIILIRGWKPLPQVSFLVTWTYRISALLKLNAF